MTPEPMTNAELEKWLDDVRDYLAGIGHWFTEDAAALAQLRSMIDAQGKQGPGEEERKEMLVAWGISFEAVDSEYHDSQPPDGVYEPTQGDIAEHVQWHLQVDRIRLLILTPPSPKPEVTREELSDKLYDYAADNISEYDLVVWLRAHGIQVTP